MPPRYKFVEVAPVTDETIETCVNEWVGQGWAFDGVRFVTTEHSKRPAMAYVSFVKDLPADAPETAPRAPKPLVREAAGGEPNVLAALHNDVD